MKQGVLSNTYLAALCLNLSMVLQAGMVIEEGVLLLLEEEGDKESRYVLTSLGGELGKGLALSEALAGLPYFPGHMVRMIGIGEKTGRLTETLQALARHYEGQENLGASIKRAVIYPGILLIMMVAVIIILIGRVLPIFNDVFGRLGGQMSPLAVGLMEAGNRLSELSLGIGLALGLLLIVLFLAGLLPKIRGSLVKVFMNHWGHRGLGGRIASARFSSALALGLRGALDTGQAIELAAALGGGGRQREMQYAECLRLLAEGKALAAALSETGLLSPGYSRMLALGSKSGQTDAAMEEIARRHERQVQEEIDRLVSAIEPALVIVTCLIVGVILLSVMLPLLGIMTSIG